MAASLAASATLFSCSSSESDLKQQITGKYAGSGENEFDHYKDTLEIKASDNGKYDVTTIANWSSAKESDPQRPFNKVAGVWNSYGPEETQVAELQLSDTTLRITEPMTGKVTALSFDTDKGTLEWPLKNGERKVYTKVKP